MAIEIKCPVCNHTTTGNFCENCGFEIHVLPAAVSPEIVTYENERVAKYKEKQTEQAENHRKEMEEKDGIIKEKDDTISKLEKDIENQADAHKKEMEKLKGDLTTAASEDSVKKDGIIKEKDQTISAKDGEISGLNGQVTTLNDQITNLKKELEEAKKKPVRLDGIVRITKGSRECYLPVFEGENIYGRSPQKGQNHHTIAIRHIEEVAPEHFTILRNESGQMVIKPIDGDLQSKGRAIPKEGKSITIQDSIKIGDEIEIKVSKYQQI